MNKAVKKCAKLLFNTHRWQRKSQNRNCSECIKCALCTYVALCIKSELLFFNTLHIFRKKPENPDIPSSMWKYSSRNFLLSNCWKSTYQQLLTLWWVLQQLWTTDKCMMVTIHLSRLQPLGGFPTPHTLQEGVTLPHCVCFCQNPTQLQLNST